MKRNLVGFKKAKNALTLLEIAALTRNEKYEKIDPRNFPSILEINNDTLNYYESLKRLKEEFTSQNEKRKNPAKTINLPIPSVIGLTIKDLKITLGLPSIGIKSNSWNSYYSIRKFSTIQNAGASRNTLAFHARFQPVIINKNIINISLIYLEEELLRIKQYFDSLFDGNFKRDFKAKLNKTNQTEIRYQRFKLIANEEYNIKIFEDWLKRSPKREFKQQASKKIVIKISNQTIDEVVNKTVNLTSKMPKKKWNYQKILDNYPKNAYNIAYTVDEFVSIHPSYFDISGLRKNKLAWDIGDEKHSGTKVFELILNNHGDFEKIEFVKQAIFTFLPINIPLIANFSQLKVTSAPHLSKKCDYDEIKEFQRYMIDLYAVDQNNRLIAAFQLKGRSALKNNSGLHDSFPEMVDLMYLSTKHSNILCVWVDIRIEDDSVVYTILPAKNKTESTEFHIEHMKLVNPMLYKVMRSPEIQHFLGNHILAIWKKQSPKFENPNEILNQVDDSKLFNIEILNEKEIKVFTNEMQELVKEVAKRFDFDSQIIKTDDVSRVFKLILEHLRSHKYPDNLHKWTTGDLWKHKVNVALQIDYYNQYQKHFQIGNDIKPSRLRLSSSIDRSS